MVVKINGAPITVTDKPQITASNKDIIVPIGNGVLGLLFLEIASRKILHVSAIHEMFAGLDNMVFTAVKEVLRCILLLLP